MAESREVRFEYRPTPRQWQALQALKIPATDADWEKVQRDTAPLAMAWGGGKGGGKSHALCVLVYLYCLSICNYFRLAAMAPRQDVPHVAWMGRKVAQVFVGTTLETWKSVIPSSCYTLVAASEKHPRHIRIADRIAVDYGGLDSRAELERFNSAEYGMIAVDQAEETSRDDVATLRGSLRKKLLHPTKGMLFLPYRALWTCNPRNCWLKDDFVDHPTERRLFIPALYTDNPHLPPGYIQTLDEAFGHRPDMLRAYKFGIWEGLSNIDQVILEEWIAAAKVRLGHVPFVKRLVTVDPAYFGDDLCVILALENTRIIGVVILPQCGAKEIAHEAYQLALEVGGCPIVVEQVGADDVSSRIRELGGHVITYNPAEASSNQERYYNKRAEVWSTVARWFHQGLWDPSHGQMVSLPEPCERFEPDGSESILYRAWREVCQQMTWAKYKFRGQRILISPKEDIKAEHDGKSPDFGDAYVNGVYHLRYVEAVRVQPREPARRRGDRRERIAKCSL